MPDVEGRDREYAERSRVMREASEAFVRATLERRARGFTDAPAPLCRCGHALEEHDLIRDDGSDCLNTRCAERCEHYRPVESDKRRDEVAGARAVVVALGGTDLYGAAAPRLGGGK